MADRTATLRQITDAVAFVRDMDGPDRERLYSRARTMRDRGLILTASARTQGREIQYSEADIAAAVVAITISLNGGSTGVIERMNLDLRGFGANSVSTQGTLAFEQHIPAILNGEGIFIRFDAELVTDGINAIPQNNVRMGTWGNLEMNEQFVRMSENICTVITETKVIPVTALVGPVFAAIFGKEG